MSATASGRDEQMTKTTAVEFAPKHIRQRHPSGLMKTMVGSRQGWRRAMPPATSGDAGVRATRRCRWDTWATFDVANARCFWPDESGNTSPGWNWSSIWITLEGGVRPPLGEEAPLRRLELRGCGSICLHLFETRPSGRSSDEAGNVRLAAPGYPCALNSAQSNSSSNL